MQWEDDTRHSKRSRAATQPGKLSGRGQAFKSRDQTDGIAAGSFDFAQDDVGLFRRDERFVKTCLAPIGCVAMNDPAFRRFVDSRNGRANLIGGAFRG
jgi:hypothetical protein